MEEKVTIAIYAYIPPPPGTKVFCPACGEPYNIWPEEHNRRRCGECQTVFAVEEERAEKEQEQKERP